MELLKALYNINSKSGCEGCIKAFVLEQLADVPLVVEEDEIGNLFITKGEARKYPCVTAHLDEVHDTSPFRIVEEASGIFGEDELGNMTGIGADDKNGLWIIIKLLHDVPVLKVALFVEEEKKGNWRGVEVLNPVRLSTLKTRFMYWLLTERDARKLSSMAKVMLNCVTQVFRPLIYYNNMNMNV